jgi:formylglycine-generating enzyme required for sulfatase activity
MGASRVPWPGVSLLRFLVALALSFLLALPMIAGPALARATKPAPRTFRDCPHCPQMVAIPAGSFSLGSPQDEPDRDPVEGPQRRIAIARFAAGRFDVTVAYLAATGKPTIGGCSWASGLGPRPDPAASWSHVDFAQDDRHPVVCIAWSEAQDYVHWLTRLTGHAYRLLSEAEWEYAARAGSATAFPWGPAPSHEQANYGAQDCCGPLASGRDRWVATSPVGSFPANAFGLYDMQGNVLQWVQDCFHAYADADPNGGAYETAAPIAAGPGVGADLAGQDACAFRMLRGGGP